MDNSELKHTIFKMMSKKYAKKYKINITDNINGTIKYKKLCTLVFEIRDYEKNSNIVYDTLDSEIARLF